MERYGAWGEKTLYGRKSTGSFAPPWLIGPDGVVMRVWRHVRADGHAEKVLAAAAADTGVLTEHQASSPVLAPSTRFLGGLRSTAA